MLQTPVHQSYLNYQQLLSSTLPPLDSPINDLLILIAIANVIQTQLIQIKDKIREMKKQCGWLEFQIIVLIKLFLYRGDGCRRWFLIYVQGRWEAGAHWVTSYLVCMTLLWVMRISSVSVWTISGLRCRVLLSVGLCHPSQQHSSSRWWTFIGNLEIK